MRRAARVLRWLGATAAAVLLLLASGVFFLERTPPGQRQVLEYAERRLEEALDGEVEVGGVRSGGLLEGATLHDVTVKGADGRPFLHVDSVVARYRWTTFLRGEVVLSNLTVYGAHLTLSRYPGEDAFNIARIFRTGDGDPGGGPARRIELQNVVLVDAFIEILEAVDPEDPPPARMLTTTIPGVEGTFRHMFFENVDAQIARALLSSPEPDFSGPVVELRSLSLVGHVFEDPLTLASLRGKVTWEAGKLTVAADHLALPSTRARGTIVADFTAEGRGGRDAGWAVDLDLESPSFSLADLRWLRPDLPDGVGEGSFQVRLTDLGDVRVAFSDAVLALEESRLSGNGLVHRDAGRALRFEDVRVRASPLALREAEAFVGKLPVEGTVQGDLTLNGPMESLAARGDLTLRAPDRRPSSAEFRGTFHLGERRGVTGLVAEISEADFGLISLFAPGSRLEGSGSGRLEATGSLAGGVRFSTELTHRPGGELPTSEVRAEGTLRQVGGSFELDVAADVAPLSLTALRSYYPDLPVSGEVTGAIRAAGPLSDIRVTTDLATPAGRLAVAARFDARDPGAFYQVEGDVAELQLSRLAEALPEPTIFTGYLRLEGRGSDPRTASVDALLRARASRVGDLDVDSAVISARVRDGVLFLDSAEGLASGLRLLAVGSMPTTEEGPDGEIRVTFAADSLHGLRPVLMERNILVQDELTEAQLESLRAQGVDTDTLPTAEEVVVGGSASGVVTLRGSLERFSAVGNLTLGQFRYGRNFLSDAEVTFSAEGLPDFGASVHARVVSDSLQLGNRSYRRIDAEVDYVRPVGAVELFLVRDEAEDYRARAHFALDSAGGQVQVETLTLRLDTLSWELEQPGIFTWDEQAVRVANISLRQSSGEGVRVVGTGVLPRQGEAAFDLDVQGLELAQVVQLLQLEDVQLEGRMDLDILVVGTADAPVITSAVEATGVRYQGYAMDLVTGQVEYRDRRFAVDLAAAQDQRRVLTMTGAIPALINLREPAFRLPDEEIDLVVDADDLPAAFVAGIFPQLVDVEGTVAGSFDIGGTIDNPAPSGSLELQNAAWTIEALGVRHEGVQGTVTLRRDATVEVDAIARADGLAHMTGSVLLAPLRNPTFDLQVSFQNFRAVERRDAEGNVSGIVRLTGTFDRPLIEGLGPEEGLRVESGVLYLEEFVRSATVVDLSDPRFEEFLDLTEPETRLIEESRNPFMQNLRVNVDLAVAQDTWLRSTEMDVEMAGNLRVSYDREQVEIVLTGVLDAVRGQYNVLGRRFQVQEGQVDFLGIPGIDPNLNIVAVTRVRRQNGPLSITATVTGTLTQPRVALGSEEAAISQSDLVSYLLFGRPSYELASGEQQQLSGAASSFVGSFVRGGIASSLGSVIAQQWGLDYFAITEVGNVGWNLGGVSQTQVEFGRYLGPDLFLVLGFQPAQVVGAKPLDTFGLRLEFAPTPAYTVEAFFEDRFQRSRSIGFQDAGLVSRRILGLSLFTEWGF